VELARPTSEHVSAQNTKITERFSVQFRAETYNTFNHRNFSIGLPTTMAQSIRQTTPTRSAPYIFVTSGQLSPNKPFKQRLIAPCARFALDL
jgi:hypothetical protein